jgi:hypothetical protein
MGMKHIFAIYRQNGARLVDNATTRTIHFVPCVFRAMAHSFGIELAHCANVVAGGLAWRSDCTFSRPVLRYSYSRTSTKSLGADDWTSLASREDPRVVDSETSVDQRQTADGVGTGVAFRDRGGLVNRTKRLAGRVRGVAGAPSIQGMREETS